MIVDKPILGEDTYLDPLFADGLVGYWLFNEGSGNKVVDISGNGYTGTIEGNISWDSGKFGSCLNSPGQAADRLTCSTWKQLSNHTIILFVKLDTIPAWVTANEQRIVCAILYGADRGILISITDNQSQTTGIISYITGNAGTFHNLNSSTALVINTWYMIVVSWDGITKRIYINGIEDNSVASTQAVGVFDYQRFITDDTAGFDGKASYIMIYDHALFASEITLLYQEPFWGFKQRDSGIYTRI